MLSQTPQQKTNLSNQIEQLLGGELKQTAQYYIKKYQVTFERKLGLDEDDLMNHIREHIWKGLLTWSPSKGANQKTYLNTVISRAFATLYERSTARKHGLLEYHADLSATGDAECFESRETGEALMLRRQEFMQDREALDGFECSVYADLLQGFNIDEMVRRHAKTRVTVISAIMRIDKRIAERRKNTQKGAIKGS